MEKEQITYGIKFKDKLGYALGDAGGQLSFSLISSFQQMFYTDVLKIKPSKISTLLFIARIWDAINDPMWGGFIDSRKPTRFGRFRPYIFGASIPLAIAAVLMFTQIPGLSPSQYLIFAYITYIFYGMMYTGANIPYGSLASVVTTDEVERSSLSMWRSVGAGGGGLPATIILPMLVYSTVEGTDIKYLDGGKLTTAVAVLAVISIGVYFLHFKLTKERVSLPPKQKDTKYSPAKAITAFLKNKPFMIMCVVNMFLIGFQFYTQTYYNYLLKNYYNRPELYSYVTVFTYLPMGMLLPFMGKLVRRFGKKEICTFGVAVSAVVNLILFALRGSSLVANPYVFLAFLFFSGAGQTFLVLEVWALVMDVLDYHELRTGRCEEGTGYACISFMRKIGQTAAGSGSAALLGVIGYDVNAVQQNSQVLDKLYDVSTLVPAIVMILLFITLKFFYPFTKAKLAEMKEQLAAQRAE